MLELELNTFEAFIIVTRTKNSDTKTDNEETTLTVETPPSWMMH